MEFQPVEPSFAYLFRASVTLGEVSHVSKVSSGERRFIPITGGSFEGEKLSGEVLPGGGDWQLIRPDGSAVLHAAYSLRTTDNSIIYVDNTGIRCGSPEILARLARGETVDPSRYYFRTTPRFETGAPQLAWLNNIIAVCSGLRLADTVIIDFYQVL